MDCNHKHNWREVKDYIGDLNVSIDFVNKFQKMVGLVKWKSKIVSVNPGNVKGSFMGSGILISKRLFLTAGHVFQSHNGFPRGQTNKVLPLSEALKHMEVCFDFLDSLDNSTRVNISKVLKIVGKDSSDNLAIDYCLLELEGSPGDSLGFVELSPEEPAQDTRLCIMAHPYDKQPKTIGSGQVKSIKENFLYHDIDTREGFSGSGIFAVAGDEGKLVGIHLRGKCFGVLNDNYGVLSKVLLEELKEFLP